MKPLKIAASDGAAASFKNAREVVALSQTDFTNVAVAVVSVNDVMAGALGAIQRTGFDIPIFLVASPDSANRPREVYKHLTDVLLQVNGIFDLTRANAEYHGNQLETAARAYEDSLLPPFFDSLKKYTEAANATFACPVTRAASSFASTRPADSFSTSSARRCFAPTCATPTSSSATC